MIGQSGPDSFVKIHHWPVGMMKGPEASLYWTKITKMQEGRAAIAALPPFREYLE
jgi:hypothetical protein